MATRIIAISHIPPHGKLRIISLNGGIMSKVGLENIKAGDKVGLYRSRDRRWIEATIDRVTATQVVVQGKRFRIKDGYEIASGSNWYRDHVAALDHEEGWNDKTTIAEQIEQGKIEAVEQERRAKAIKTIYAQGWRDLSTETLEAIVAILDKAK